MKKILMILAMTTLVFFGLSNLILLRGNSMLGSDFVLFNAKIPGMQGPKSIIIKDGKVLKIVSNAQSYAFIDDKTKTQDAKGQFVTAGFKDSHLHLGAMGKYYNYHELSRDIDLKSISAVNDWVIIKGLTNELEKSFKDNTQLNEAFKNSKACIIHESFHMMICNENALNFAGVKSKDGRTDEHQFKKMLSHFPADTKDSVKSDLLKAQELLIKQGIYEVDNMDVNELEL